MADGKLTCFQAGGHRTKSGKECGYFVAPGSTSCPHHAADKSRQTEILQKAQRQRKEATIPKVDTNDFKTLDDCLRTQAAVVEILCKEKVVDFRRLDMILKACSGASAIHATKAVERQNELLLQLDGHGAGVQVLQRLREAPLRVLPGRQRVLDLSKVIEGKASTDKQAEAYPTNESDSSNEPKGSA